MNGLESILDHMSYYRCPICGNKYEKKDSVIIEVKTDKEYIRSTGKHFNNGFFGSSGTEITKSYVQRCWNIRICNECAKHRNNKNYGLKLALVITILLILFIVCYGINKLTLINYDSIEIGSLILGIIGYILGSLILCFIVFAILLGAALPTGKSCNTDIDLDKAYNYNAIVDPNTGI